MHLSRKPTSKLDFPIRIVVDYHVDRTRVEDLQGLKLSVTNNPIVLFQLLGCFRGLFHGPTAFTDLLELALNFEFFADTVFLAEGEPPDPIPNSEVKTSMRRWYYIVIDVGEYVDAVSAKDSKMSFFTILKFHK